MRDGDCDNLLRSRWTRYCWAEEALASATASTSAVSRSKLTNVIDEQGLAVWVTLPGTFDTLDDPSAKQQRINLPVLGNIEDI